MFHQFTTSFDFMKHHKEKKMGVKKYTLEMFKKDILTVPSNPVQKIAVNAEINWIENNRPYYNIRKEIIEPAFRLKAGDISIKLLDVPGGYKTVVLNLPYNECKVQNIMVYNSTYGLLFCIKTREDILGFGIKHSVDVSIEEAVSSGFQNVIGKEIPEQNRSIIKEAILLVAMSKFLNDNPDSDFIRPDIVSRYLCEWETASQKRREEMIRVSKKTGHNGYNIGLFNEIVENAGRLSESKEGGTGRQLEYAHIRTGHLHAVRCGPGKKDIKIMWFRPTIVNKDKPFNV